MEGAPPKIESANPPAPVDLRTLMCVMDLADQSRARLKERADEENPDSIALNKETLASQLRDQYRKQGIAMPEDAIREAVDEFVDSQSRYERSLDGAALFFALLYIRRGLILTSVACLAAVAGIVAGIESHQARATRIERADQIRAQVGNVWRQWQSSDQAAAEVRGQEDDFARAANRLIAGNPSVAPFQTMVTQWADEGRKDHATVRQQLDQLHRRIDDVKHTADAQIDPPLKTSALESTTLNAIATDLNAAGRTIAASRIRLDAEKLALKTWSMYVEESYDFSSKNFLASEEREKFGNTLQEAEASLRAAQFADAETKLEQNQRLFAEATTRGHQQADAAAALARASDNLKSLLQRVRSEAADDQTRAEVERRIHDEELDLTTGDLNLINAKTKSLQQIDTALNSEFLLRIPSKPPKGKTGVQRTYDRSGMKQWYIVVEAVDANNQRVPYPVRNIETGETKSVSVWAEAVPNDVMSALRQEITTRGYITHPEFGRKRRGKLNIEYSMISASTGEITSW